MRLVDLGAPTSFLDHVYVGCTQREGKSNESNIEEDKQTFVSRISAGANENSPVVIRCGRSCEKVRGKILRTGQQKD